MVIMREPADLHLVEDDAIRQLMAQRFAELPSDEFDWSELGYFVLVQLGDNIAELETSLHIGITTGYCCPVNFGQTGFIPSFELIEEHATCYELVYVLDDSGYGVTLWVSMQPETELTAFCKTFTPAAPPM